MKIFFFICLLLSFSEKTFAQIKYLVFDLDGLLVQGVPARNVEQFKEKDLLITQQEGSQNRYYYVAPYAAGVIRSLNMNPQILIHFYSTRDPRWVHSALNKIYVHKEKGITLANFVEANSASKFLTSEDLVNGKIDLRKVTSDLNNVVYITATRGQLAAGQESQEFYTGQNFYVFESFALAQAERTRVGDSSPHLTFIPKDETEWELERFRFPRLNAAIRYALKSPKGNFTEDMISAFNNEPEKKISLGIKQISDDWVEIGPRWVINNGKVTGCANYNNITDEHLGTLALSICQDKLTKIYELRLDDASKTAKGCRVLTSPEKALISEQAVSVCYDKVSLSPMWMDVNKKSCVYYTDNLYRVGNAPAAKCKDTYYLKNPESSEFEVIDSSDDLSKLTDEEIFSKNHPSFTDLMKLWQPYHNNPSIGFTLNDCRVPQHGYHTIRWDSNGLLKECQPDTLYSWGPQGKLDNLKSWMGNGEWVKEFRPLFMVRSPVGSFGYGNVPIRVKLKKNVRWVYTTESHSHCNSASVSEKQNTVWFRTMPIFGGGNVLLDYTVCGPGPIESWSYGQKEHYDEVVKEYSWITSGTKGEMEYELYMSASSGNMSYFRRGIDGYDFSHARFIQYLGNFLDKITKKDGEIFWNPDVPVSERTKTNHFKTTVPMYYNHY
jgi:hypothetical protein